LSTEKKKEGKKIKFNLTLLLLPLNFLSEEENNERRGNKAFNIRKCVVTFYLNNQKIVFGIVALILEQIVCLVEIFSFFWPFRDAVLECFFRELFCFVELSKKALLSISKSMNFWTFSSKNFLFKKSFSKHQKMTKQ
jgi:hypothetical protein